MKQIICPNCHEAFTIDESQYKEIESQVRNELFENELKKQEEALRKQYESKLELERQKSQNELGKKLEGQSSSIQQLKEQIAVLEKEKEDSIALATSKKDTEIAELKGKVANAEQIAKLQVQEAVSKEREKQAALEIENKKLEGDLKSKEQEAALEIRSLKEAHAAQLKMKDDEVAFYKEMKAKLSTKDIGESLEQYCHNEFNKIRSITYPRAYFEKDNDVIDGTKGDFVFKNYDENGTEYLSIMFEMKNEADETKTKHKNEDFFKKLDEDRTKKGCKYAVLVSMLEQDNELYNAGIVDVSYRYQKMYVIRPQFFLPLIALLDGATHENANAIARYEEESKRQVDVKNFEDKLIEFQTKFGTNFEHAQNQFNQAIIEIDKTIEHLHKVREDLTKSANHLRIANDKAQALSIKKLTKDSPTLAAKFEAIEAEAEEK